MGESELRKKECNGDIQERTGRYNGLIEKLIQWGKMCIRDRSETYGYITTTPKLKWANYNIVGAFQEALGVPVGFDTDVDVYKRQVLLYMGYVKNF